MKLDTQTIPEERGRSGPIPEENLPGHHDAVDQDKPDLDAFAEKLGIPTRTDRKKAAKKGTSSAKQARARKERDTATVDLRDLGIEEIGRADDSPTQPEAPHRALPVGGPDPHVGVSPSGTPMPAGPALPRPFRWGAHLVLGPLVAAGHLAERVLGVIDGRPRDTGAEA